MAPCPAIIIKTGASCVLLLLLLSADWRLRPVAGQAPPEPELAATIEADADGRGNGSRGGARSATAKVASTIDCQVCEATCRAKCLINNLLQWGTCYQRCRADNCDEWCR